MDENNHDGVGGEPKGIIAKAQAELNMVPVIIFSATQYQEDEGGQLWISKDSIRADFAFVDDTQATSLDASSVLEGESRIIIGVIELNGTVPTQDMWDEAADEAEPILVAIDGELVDFVNGEGD